MFDRQKGTVRPTGSGVGDSRGDRRTADKVVCYVQEHQTSSRPPLDLL